MLMVSCLFVPFSLIFCFLFGSSPTNENNDSEGKMRKMTFTMSHYSEKLGFLKLQYNEQIKLQTS